MTDVRLDFTKLKDSNFSLVLEKEADKLVQKIEFSREKGVCGLTPTAFSIWLYFRKINVNNLEQLAVVKEQIADIIDSANRMTEMERDEKRNYISNSFYTDTLNLSDEELYELYIWNSILF